MKAEAVVHSVVRPTEATKRYLVYTEDGVPLGDDTIFYFAVPEADAQDAEFTDVANLEPGQKIELEFEEEAIRLNEYVLKSVRRIRE